MRRCVLGCIMLFCGELLKTYGFKKIQNLDR